MALLFFKYRTDYGNTIIASSVNSFTLGANEAQLQVDFTIPPIQQFYLYRVSGSSVLVNTDTNIANYTLGVLNINNVVDIYSVSDFPTPNSGATIQLYDNYVYRINGTVNIGSNRISLGASNVIKGSSTFTDTIVGTNASSLIFGTNITVSFQNVAFRNLNSAGTIFNVKGGSDKILSIQDSVFSQTRCGSIGGFNTIVLNTVSMNQCYDGIKITGNTGNTGLVRIFQCQALLPNTGFTAFDFNSGNFLALSIDSILLNLPTNTIGIKAPTGTTSITDGSVIGSNFYGGGTYITPFTKTQKNWEFNHNQGIDDSAKVGFFAISGNSTVTVITNTTSYVKVAGTNNRSTTERFTATDNRLTYNGFDTENFSVEITGDLIAPVNNQTISIALYKNGNTRIGETNVRTSTAGTPQSFAYVDIVNLSTNDFVEIFTRNKTSTNDPTIVDLQFTVRF